MTDLPFLSRQMQLQWPSIVIDCESVEMNFHRAYFFRSLICLLIELYPFGIYTIEYLIKEFKKLRFIYHLDSR